jgi:hypothetical protein
MTAKRNSRPARLAQRVFLSQNVHLRLQMTCDEK